MRLLAVLVLCMTAVSTWSADWQIFRNEQQFREALGSSSYYEETFESYPERTSWPDGALFVGPTYAFEVEPFYLFGMTVLTRTGQGKCLVNAQSGGHTVVRPVGPRVRAIGLYVGGTSRWVDEWWCHVLPTYVTVRSQSRWAGPQLAPPNGFGFIGVIVPPGEWIESVDVVANDHDTYGQNRHQNYDTIGKVIVGNPVPVESAGLMELEH